MRLTVFALCALVSCGGSWEPSGAPLASERPMVDAKAIPQGHGWVCTAIEEPMLLCARDEAQCATMKDELANTKDTDAQPLDCTRLPHTFVFTAARHAYYARSLDECEDLARMLIDRDVISSPSRCLEVE